MRLIDADALIVATQNFCDGYKVKWTDRKVLSWINHAPTIDAVPVVRCKDCKYSRERNEDEKRYIIEGVLICNSADACDECWNPVFPDHFCSYGERRTDV